MEFEEFSTPFLPSASAQYTQGDSWHYLTESSPVAWLLSSYIFPNFLSTTSTVRGVTRIFQRGGHTLSNRGYPLDCHVDLHAVFYLMGQKRLTNEGNGHPWTPPPPPPPPASYGLDHAFVLMLVVRSLCYCKISPSMTSSTYFFLDNKLIVQGFFLIPLLLF